MPVTIKNKQVEADAIDFGGISDALLLERPALAALVWFLRFDIAGPKSKHWEDVRKFLPAAEFVAQGPVAARRIQTALRRELTVLLNPKQRLTIEEADRILLRLTQQANTTRGKRRWEVVRFAYDPQLPPSVVQQEALPEGLTVITLGHKDPQRKVWLSGPPLTLPSVQGGTEPTHWHVHSQTSTPDARSYFYGLVVQLLADGELQDLRSCPQCQTFFVAEDLRKEFCSAHCRDTFNNKQRLGSGYFFKLRHSKREKDLRKARKLLAAGKTLEEVSTEMGLSAGVLRRDELKRELQHAHARKED